MGMERKLFAHIVTKQQPTESGETTEKLYEGVATTSDVDRVGERVNIKGLKNLDDYQKNPVLLFNHDINYPIGRIEHITVTDNEIRVAFRFANTPRAQEIRQLVDDGVLNSLSIGFLSLRQKREGNVLVHDEWMWVETSVVTVPANPHAVIVKDTEPAQPEREMETEQKGTTPFMDWDIYEDMEREWDADESEVRWRKFVGVETNEDLQDPEKRRKYRGRFFWWDGEGTTFGGYKLPFVDVINGKPYAIWRGIVAAMAALLGARGGVHIPDEDREKVYNHITRYYRKAGKEPPEFHKALEFVRKVEKFVGAVEKSLNGVRR